MGEVAQPFAFGQNPAIEIFLAQIEALEKFAVVEPLDGTEVPYLNRLSDWLFVASRHAGSRLGIAEVLWRPGSTA